MSIDIAGRPFQFPEVDEKDYPWASNLRDILGELGGKIAPDFICRAAGDLQKVLSKYQSRVLIIVDADQYLTTTQIIKGMHVTIIPRYMGITISGISLPFAFDVRANALRVNGFRFTGFRELAMFSEDVYSSDLSNNHY